MSSKELAYSFIDDLTGESLETAVIILARLSKMDKNAGNVLKPRMSFEEMDAMLKPMPPDFDPEKERKEYYKEKYGL